jgi:nucleolar protein 9
MSRFDQNVLYDRLQGHYGEIAMNPSGSFLAEKCFTASNFSHKEAIVIVDRAK